MNAVATKRRKRRRSGVPRYARPRPCQRCLRPIIFGAVLEPDGKLRRRKGRLVLLALNAQPTSIGAYEYVRGPEGRPVVRELDLPDRLVSSDLDRWSRHLDLTDDDRRPGVEP